MHKWDCSAGILGGSRPAGISPWLLRVAFSVTFRSRQVRVGHSLENSINPGLPAEPTRFSWARILPGSDRGQLDVIRAALRPGTNPRPLILGRSADPCVATRVWRRYFTKSFPIFVSGTRRHCDGRGLIVDAGGFRCLACGRPVGQAGQRLAEHWEGIRPPEVPWPILPPGELP